MDLAARHHQFARSAVKRADFRGLESTCQFSDITGSMGPNRTFRTSPFLPEVDHEVFKSLEIEHGFIQLVSIERLAKSPVSNESDKG